MMEMRLIFLNIQRSKVLIGTHPDNKVHEANMGPIWDRQDPGGPRDVPMNIAIWACLTS